MVHSDHTHRVVIILACLILLATTAFSVPPSPEAIEKWKAEGVLAERLSTWVEFKLAGAGSPVAQPVFSKDRADGLAAATNVDTASIAVILVDFDDHPYNGSTYEQSVAGMATDFDSILFSEGLNPSGSMTEFYLENSYGQFHIIGTVYGWYRMPETYDYYVLSELDAGRTRSRVLATDAISAAHLAGLNFADHDYDSNGVCDGLIIIHAGHGAEEGIFGVWSHEWFLKAAMPYDGVMVYDYIHCAEERRDDLSPIGVPCHEYGHFLGLPDLYDISDTSFVSDGLGRWSLMASGPYNGTGKYPAHMDAWCKAQVGFITPIDVSGNLDNAEIPEVVTSGVVYRLQNPMASIFEYWLVENRQLTGFDRSLPGAGLCIYHVDESVVDNSNPNHYRVALEQADGHNDLAFTYDNDGDAGDTWPGSTDNRNFHDQSIPNSRTFFSGSSQIGVWEISDSGPMMYADLDVSFSRPWVRLDDIQPFLIETWQDSRRDDVIEPGDTVSISFAATNLMRTTYNAEAVLSTGNLDVDIIDASAHLDDYFDGRVHTNFGKDSILFVMPDSIRPTIDSFSVVITCDSLLDGSLRSYADTFSFTLTLGAPTVLIVDDDSGEDYELAYTDVLDRMQMPYDVWNVNSSGSPIGTDLTKYSIVFWHTGDSASGVISASEIETMRAYLDNGGSLCLSSLSGLYDMRDIDSAFMANYFNFVPADTNIWFPVVGGDVNNPWFAGMAFAYINKFLYDLDVPVITPVGAGEGAMVIGAPPTHPSQGNCGVSFSGPFKTVYLSFPIEYIYNNNATYLPSDTLIARIINFFGIGFVTDIIESDRGFALPQSFTLQQNYPNPFNPVTTIAYSIKPSDDMSGPAKTNLTVFNLLGRQVKVLVDEVQSAGNYRVEWDGTSDGSSKVATGIYFYRLSYGDNFQTRKMVLLK